MPEPLTTRDALIGVLGKHQTVATGLGEWACACSPLEWRPSGLRPHHLADALLASGALIDATKLAEDEPLVERVYEGQWDVDVSTVRWWGGRRDVVRLLKATAAALSAQSERAEVER